MRKLSRLMGVVGVCAMVVTAGSAAWAASVTVDVYKATTNGRGDSIGTVTIEETNYGLVFTPNLSGV